MEKRLEEIVADVRKRVRFPSNWNPITNQADAIKIAQMCYPNITFAQNGPRYTIRWQQTEIPQVVDTIHLGTVICKRIIANFAILPEYEIVEYDERDGLVEYNITDSALHLADEYGVNLETVKGSGADGRILKKDVQDYIDKELNTIQED